MKCKKHNSTPERKEKIKLQRKHHKIDKELRRETNSKYIKQKCKTNIIFKIGYYTRLGQNAALSGNWKAGHSVELLMCTIAEFKVHIEKQFRIGMTWAKRGNGPGKWNIDHIIPINYFNMLDPVEQYMCFRWQNQRPIWWKENQSKSKKIIYHKNNTSELC